MQKIDQGKLSRSDRNQDLDPQRWSDVNYGIREMTAPAERSLAEVLEEKGKSVENILAFKPASYYQKLRTERQADINHIKQLLLL